MPSPEKADLLELKIMDTQNQPASGTVRDVSEGRRKPRFKLAVDISIYSESCGSLKGRTLDISEIGIAAVLGDDVPLGEVVKLNLTLPSGPVTTSATVRQRSSLFRYGFEFIEPNPVSEILQSACRQLAVQQCASGGR
jgi:c-di-GMP-binding flagellar brake protein YcgR